MVWKRVDNVDGGDADHFGGNDIDKISALLSGDANVDVVNIDSDWTFRNRRLKLRNPANTRSLSVAVPAIASDLDISFPLVSTNDELVARVTAAELENKTIDGAKNTLLGMIKMPSSGKWGIIQAGNTIGGNVGQGLFNGFIDLPGPPVRLIDPAPLGGYWRYNTGTTVDTIAGIRFAQTFTRKEFDCRFKAKFRVPPTTGHSSTRLYVGVNTDVVMEADDSPMLTTESGVMMGWRSTDSNFMVFRNSGTNSASATPSVVNTNIAKTTSVRSVEIKFTGGGSSVTVTLYDASVSPETVLFTQTYTTNLPASGFSLAPSIILMNSAGVGRDFDIFYAELEAKY